MTHKASQEHTPRGSVRKALLVAAGTLSVALGVLGIFIPLLPTTPFLLLAAACYMRSSDRLYRRLITHRWFGRYIRNYREHRAMTLGAKILAIALLWSTMSYAILAVVQHWALRGLLSAIAIGVTVHLLKLKTATRETLKARPTEETDPHLPGEPSPNL